MKSVKDFKVLIDKNKILNIINSYYEFPKDSIALSEFHIHEKLVREIINPTAYFKLDNMPTLLQSNMLKECSNIIYSIITIGEEITEIIDNSFNENRFEEGLILDAISTYVLFDLSNQLNEIIFEYASRYKMGLTCRIAPGDGEIDINYLRTIVSEFSGQPKLKFSIADNYLIKPYKSLCYVFGADVKIPINHLDHHCDQCHNINCIMRNSGKKIRGPYDNF